MSTWNVPRSLYRAALRITSCLGAICCCMLSEAHAQETPGPDAHTAATTSVVSNAANSASSQAGTTHMLGLSAYASNIASDLGITWQASFGASWRLRVEARSGRVMYDTIGGLAVEDGNAYMLRVGPRAVIARSGPLALSLHADAVARVLTADEEEALVDDRAVVAGIELGIVGDVRVAERWAMQLGMRVPVEMEVDPIVTAHRVGPLTTFDLSWAASDSTRIAAWAVAGGQFGSDGDGLKMEAGGGLTLRWYFGGHARSQWIY